ncbi:hypothetical protein [Duganella lactea]|nr:hypothetical protein [Duganella lactea]
MTIDLNDGRASIIKTNHNANLDTHQTLRALVLAQTVRAAAIV